MVTEIHIFLEGDGRNTKALIHQGFSSFLGSLVKRARQKKFNLSSLSLYSITQV